MNTIIGDAMQITLKAQSATLPAYVVVEPGTAAHTVVLHDTNTAQVIGLTAQQSEGGAGSSVLITIFGGGRGIGGASVSAGSVVIPQTATGYLVAETGFINTTTALVNYSVGIALGAADTNSVFSVLVRPQQIRFDF